jgi:hypothetical protein
MAKEDRLRRHPAAVFCSETCSARSVRRGVAASNRRCARCGAKIDDGSGRIPGRRTAALAGRPTSYCSSECVREREKTLSRALKALARNTMPNTESKLRALLQDVESLAKHWGLTAVALADRSSSQAQHPPPTVKPDDHAKVALREYVNRLRAAAGEYSRQAQVEASRKRDADQAAQRKKHRERQAGIEAQWRHDLEQQAGDAS